MAIQFSHGRTYGWPWLTRFNHGYQSWSTIGLWNGTMVQPWLSHVVFFCLTACTQGWAGVQYNFCLQFYVWTLYGLSSHTMGPNWVLWQNHSSGKSSLTWNNFIMCEAILCYLQESMEVSIEISDIIAIHFFMMRVGHTNLQTITNCIIIYSSSLTLLFPKFYTCSSMVVWTIKS